MKKLPSYLKGLIVTVAGILVLSPDSLLVRLIATDAWTLLFWRGLLMAVGTSAGLALIYRGKLLHSGVIPDPGALTDDPAEARLTINMFLQGR